MSLFLKVIAPYALKRTVIQCCRITLELAAIKFRILSFRNFFSEVQYSKYYKDQFSTKLLPCLPSGKVDTNQHTSFDSPAAHPTLHYHPAHRKTTLLPMIHPELAVIHHTLSPRLLERFLLPLLPEQPLLFIRSEQLWTSRQYYLD